jgi:hypothetical protein
VKLDLVATMKPFEEFRRAYEDEGGEFSDDDLLMAGLANGAVPDRYQIAGFLLDQGARADQIQGRGAYSALHLLLGHGRQDIDQLTPLCRRLVDAGCDVNALDANSVDALQGIVNLKVPDDALEDLYDLWFSFDLANIETPNRAGLSPLDLARKLPYRADLVTRMEQFLAARD